MSLSRRSLLCGLAAAQFVRSQTPALKAGAATANISPSLGSSIAGFTTDRKATDIHDELTVRCAVLESGSTRMLLATIDSCMVPRSSLDRVRSKISKENGIDPAFILMSSTHTHSAPPAMHLFQSMQDSRYVELIESRLADAAAMAFRRLRPARVGGAVGSEPTLVFNRRYFMREGSIPPDPFGGTTDKVIMNPPAQSADIIKPAGPVDADHGVIAAIGNDGQPIWIYGNYALHYAGFNPSSHVSADYFGAWTRRVEHSIGGDCVALISNGCAGNVNGINFYRPAQTARDYSVIERTAAVLCFETLRVLRTISYDGAPRLAAAIDDVEVGTRLPSKEDLAEAIRRVGENPGNEFKDRPSIYARETVFVAKFPNKTRVPVQGLRIGNIGIGTFPGETFVELGQRVKSSSPHKMTVTVSIANDACGYIPTVEAFDVGGYETWRAKSSYVEREAASKITSGVERALGRI